MKMADRFLAQKESNLGCKSRRTMINLVGKKLDLTRPLRRLALFLTNFIKTTKINITWAWVFVFAALGHIYGELQTP